MRRQNTIHVTLSALALLLGALPLMISGLGALAVPAVILAALNLGMHLQGALAAGPEGYAVARINCGPWVGITMAISDQELIDELSKEIDYRQMSGPTPADRDRRFAEDAEKAIADLKMNPGAPEARRRAKNIANRIQSRPFGSRHLD